MIQYGKNKTKKFVIKVFCQNKQEKLTHKNYLILSNAGDTLELLVKRFILQITINIKGKDRNKRPSE